MVVYLTTDTGNTYVPELTKNEPSEDDSFPNKKWCKLCITIENTGQLIKTILLL